MKRYSIITTRKCNWSCPYCITDTHGHDSDITFDDIKAKLEQIEPNSEVSLSGGEPGLIEPEVIDYIFTELVKKNSDITVLTNGLFFKKYAFKYDKYISDYLYHCSENLDLKDEVLVPIDINPDKIEYMIVVSDNNIHNLEKFLELHPTVETVFSADATMVLGEMGHSLSKKNALQIAKKFKNRLNKKSIRYLLHNCSVSNSPSFEEEEITCL